MDSNHQFGLPYHAVAIPASLKTHNNAGLSRLL